MQELMTHYRRLRKPRFSPYNDRQMFVQTAHSALSGARHALRHDAIVRRWREADGEMIGEYDALSYLPEGGARVRIVEHPDMDIHLGDLFGDAFCPDTNPEIKPEILEREREAQIARVERDGVWGYVAEYWDGRDWEHADSVWGFIGDDFQGSGYDTDLMGAALDALDQCRACEARKLEAARPDMYAA